jgi:two-component sensor histidine kinase
MNPASPQLTEFQRKVASRFGLVPNFFLSASDAPEITERLWEFATSAYFDNPIPSLFKERLFVYLSRFCEMRYCIVRHCAFLLGYGHSAGDPSAPVQTIDQAIRLLSAATPWERGVDSVIAALDIAPAADWPEPESDLEDKIFSAATLVFVEARRSSAARNGLRRVLGGRRYEHLLGLLAFVRTAHYWTLLHPELEYEDDAKELLKINDELARRLLDDPEAARCDMGQRLFAELEDLRTLNERRELEAAKRALEEQVAQKEILLKEVNHRVKNSLQIVSSLLSLQSSSVHSTEAREALQVAASRVLAVAAVHERLYTGADVRQVALDDFLKRLCSDIGRALGRGDCIELNLGSIVVPTDRALPIALAVNELVTNALKYAPPPWRLEVSVEPQGGLRLVVSDAGQGPSEGKSASGMGSRIVDALARQIDATWETSRLPEGYQVMLKVPASSIYENSDR